MKVVNDCLGIDVSKDFLECCFGSLSTQEQPTFSEVKKFKNDESGFKELLKWALGFSSSRDLIFVMEATGVYYENFAYWLHDKDLRLSVVLPNMVKHFAMSHNVKTKTDSVDAKVLSRMGLERPLAKWHVHSKNMREIKLLVREYRDLKDKVTRSKNQLHAKSSGYKCPSSIIRRLKKQIRMLENQILEVEAELRMLVMNDSALADKVERIETIPGVSFMTIICILGETNSFAIVRNAKQLVSYSGLDVQHNQSGSKYGKTRISKKGNSYIRKALYMPALCALQHNPNMKVFYDRLNETKPVKKIAVTAVARKILVLVYTLWKNESEYNPNYFAEIT